MPFIFQFFIAHLDSKYCFPILNNIHCFNAMYSVPSLSAKSHKMCFSMWNSFMPHLIILHCKCMHYSINSNSVTVFSSMSLLFYKKTLLFSLLCEYIFSVTRTLSCKKNEQFPFSYNTEGNYLKFLFRFLSELHSMFRDKIRI